MLRSPVTRILSYLFTAFLRVLETLKNVNLLLSSGGLYTNIINHFLFGIISSNESLRNTGFKIVYSLNSGPSEGFRYWKVNEKEGHLRRWNIP